MSALARAVRGFGHFWLDFLIGDTPEIFVGALIIVAAALILRHHRPTAIALVLVLTIVVLVASTYRGRKRSVSERAGTRSDPLA